MEQTPIEIDLTPLVSEWLALAVNYLASVLVLSVVLYAVVGVPLLLYLNRTFDRRHHTTH